jgi:hypothetical protein
MGTVAKHIQLVEILARRHVAQRKRLADQRRLIGRERTLGYLAEIRARFPEYLSE